MQTIKGDVQLDNGRLSIPIFSYKNTFFDGDERLHPAIFAGKLFVMSRVCTKGEVLVLSSENIISEHLKDVDLSYLIKAPNQKARVFNPASAGTLVINQIQLTALVEAGADLSYFTTLNV